MSMVSSKETLHLKAIIHILEKKDIAHILRSIVQCFLQLLLNEETGFCEEIFKVGDKFSSFILPQFRQTLRERTCDFVFLEGYSITGSSLLTEMDLSESRFEKIEMSSLKFSLRTLSSCNFRSCTLINCSLINGLCRWGALKDCLLIDCVIHMDFDGMSFDGVSFLNCQFFCSISNSTFKNVKFHECAFTWLELLSDICDNCEFLDCTCPENAAGFDEMLMPINRGLTLRSTTFYESKFRGCYFPGGSFYGRKHRMDYCEFDDCQIPETNISGTMFRCNFRNCIANGSLFEYSVFERCEIGKSDFSMTSLRGAFISRTIFLNTDMSYVDFRSYNSCKTIIESSTFDSCPNLDQTISQRGTISSDPDCLKSVVFKGPGLSREDFDI